MIKVPASNPTARVASVPAPIGGINAVSSLAQMPETDALRLINLIPTSYGCALRNGYQQYATGLNGAVSTVVGNVAVDGTKTLFAATQDTFYDVSGNSEGIALIAGLSTGLWQHVNFANSAGTHLVLFNGIDYPIWYTKKEGVRRLVGGDGIVEGTISGVSPTRLIQATIHQRRIWAVERDSTLAWFLAPDSIYGKADFYDFGPFFKQGGYLAALGTWSSDMGDGSDDRLVAISSEGDAVVFAGTDATDSTKWSLVGVYNIGGPPIGRRFTTNIAGDLLVITQAGVVSMSTVQKSSSVAATSETVYSSKVQLLLNDILSNLGDLDGWSISFMSSSNLLYINIPSVYSNGNGQLVANVVNGSWCTFSGIDAKVWFEMAGVQYFGADDGTIYKMVQACRDKILLDGTGGEPIEGVCQQAYSNIGSPVIQKQVGLYRPTFLSSRVVSTYSTLQYDYNEVVDSYVTDVLRDVVGSHWNLAIWNSDVWGGGLLSQRDWRSGVGVGTAVSLMLVVKSDYPTTWVATDYTYIAGGPL